MRTPHACQSQSPAHVSVEDTGSADAEDNVVNEEVEIEEEKEVDVNKEFDGSLVVDDDDDDVRDVDDDDEVAVALEDRVDVDDADLDPDLLELDAELDRVLVPEVVLVVTTFV